MTKTVSSPLTLGSNKVLAILLFSFAGWSSLIVEGAISTGDLGVILLAGGLSQLLSLAFVVFLIILSFKTKRDFEQFLASKNTPVSLNGFLLFILPFWYQYYVAYNANTISAAQRARVVAAPAQPAAQAGAQASAQDDIAAKIAKLSALKASGDITEEQFEAAKQKLLS